MNEEDEKLEKEYNSCIDYLSTTIKQTVFQMEKDRINTGIINIDLKLSQCESFVVKPPINNNFNTFSSRTIQKNNTANYLLDPLKYVQSEFTKYKITNIDYNYEYPPKKYLVNISKLVIEEIIDSKIYYSNRLF
jgi:hypothetical protein